MITMCRDEIFGDRLVVDVILLCTLLKKLKFVALKAKVTVRNAPAPPRLHMAALVAGELMLALLDRGLLLLLR
jgi:hypothetical protein